MSPALPEAGEQKYQKTAMVRSPNMMKRILRKKEDKENNRLETSLNKMKIMSTEVLRCFTYVKNLYTLVIIYFFFTQST